MCGFVGGTDPAWDYAAALTAITHRGPDAGELRLTGPVRVGFRRLSIIDLRPSANQPMLAPDGTSWIVFNGEIYGYRELRRSLIERGHAVPDRLRYRSRPARVSRVGRRLRRPDRRHVRHRHLGCARARAPTLPRPPRHQASLLLLRRPPFRVRFRAQGSRESAAVARPRGRPQRLLRLPRLPLCACAENALQALLQAAAGARARVFAGYGSFAVASPLLEHPHTGFAAESAARSHVRGAACTDRCIRRGADGRGRAARLLSFGRSRLERRRRSGCRDGHARRDVLDRFRRRRSLRDAVCARSRTTLRDGSSRAHLVASARGRSCCRG